MPILETIAVGASIANILSPIFQNAKARKYNSVTSQVQRLREAGLSPSAIYHGVGQQEWNPLPLQFDTDAITNAATAEADISLKKVQKRKESNLANKTGYEALSAMYKSLEDLQRYQYGNETITHIERDQQGNYTGAIGTTPFRQKWATEMQGARQQQQAQTNLTVKQAASEIAKEEHIQIMADMVGTQRDKIEAGREWWLNNEELSHKILSITEELQRNGLSKDEVEKEIFKQIAELPSYVRPWISGILLGLKYIGGTTGSGGSFQLNIGN